MTKTKEELEKEKDELVGTVYHDFIKGIRKNSIYKSMQLMNVKEKTAYYECEPYDDAYPCSIDEKFFETCEKLERAFKKYYRHIFEKYDVNNIVVDIYDQYSCSAGLNVFEDGHIDRQNF
ncbi:hypothetical protein [Pediococcus acidilactici]|uniref:hypothetical protein n=1 Tax=Pediococcus acidilactici TaxID=1254 RepID=UPI0013270DC5|nr:hypothetical protein [Pediococcus acidilactici]KAF0513419.1 hypothetical protein GBP27_08815 [Pediococcus acidilactici]